MAGDGVTMRLQKEVVMLQKEMGEVQNKLNQLDSKWEAKMESRFQAFQEEFEGKMLSLLEKYFGNTTTTIQAKGKGVLGGPPPSFPAKDSFEAPNNLSDCQTITHKGLGFPPNELISMSTPVSMELIFRVSGRCQNWVPEGVPEEDKV